MTPSRQGCCYGQLVAKTILKKKKNYEKNSKSRYNAVSIIFSSCCYHKKMNISIHSMNQTRSGYHKVCTKNLAIQPIKIQMPNKHIFSNFQYYNEYLKKSKKNDWTNNKPTSRWARTTRFQTQLGDISGQLQFKFYLSATIL